MMKKKANKKKKKIRTQKVVNMGFTKATIVVRLPPWVGLVNDGPAYVRTHFLKCRLVSDLKCSKFRSYHEKKDLVIKD